MAGEALTVPGASEVQGSTDAHIPLVAKHNSGVALKNTFRGFLNMHLAQDPDQIETKIFVVNLYANVYGHCS